MKYIILDNALQNAILFDETMEHSQVADGRKCSSAGFCTLTVDVDRQIKVSVWGGSVTLKLQSDPRQDVSNIKRAITFRGI